MVPRRSGNRPGEADGGGHGVQVGADLGDLDHGAGGLGAEHAEAVGGGGRAGRAGRDDQALAGRAVVAVEHADAGAEAVLAGDGLAPGRQGGGLEDDVGGADQLGRGGPVHRLGAGAGQPGHGGRPGGVAAGDLERGDRQALVAAGLGQAAPGEGHRQGDPAGAEQQGRAGPGPAVVPEGELAAQGPDGPGDVGVAADQPALAHEHGVDRPELVGRPLQVVDQAGRRLLVRGGQVDPGERARPDLVQRRGQLRGAGRAGLVGPAVQPGGPVGGLVQGRGQGMGERPAEDGGDRHG